jgi:hypothetical protein
MEPKCPLYLLQEAANGYFPEPNESNPHSEILFR